MKSATKVYYEGTKPVVSEYEEKLSVLEKVRQKLGKKPFYGTREPLKLLTDADSNTIAMKK